jgi:hypothetical protein
MITLCLALWEGVFGLERGNSHLLSTAKGKIVILLPRRLEAFVLQLQSGSQFCCEFLQARWCGVLIHPCDAALYFYGKGAHRLSTGTAANDNVAVFALVYLILPGRNGFGVQALLLAA